MTNLQVETISTPGGVIRAAGTEARVVRDIADRQAVYCRRIIETMEQAVVAQGVEP